MWWTPADTENNWTKNQEFITVTKPTERLDGDVPEIDH